MGREGHLEDKRGLLPRLGIVLLNFIAPGLGLLRLGHWKVGLAAFATSSLIGLLLEIGPPLALVALTLALGLAILIVVASIWLSWRFSGRIEAERSWYSNWYIILGGAVLVILCDFLTNDKLQFRYRSFYLPSEAMEPTFAKGDRFIAYMGTLGALRRGDLVLTRTPEGTIYVKRVAALGGDRFSMNDGIVFLNGSEISQRPIGLELKQWSFGPVKARRFAERFPGEVSDHEVYDVGPTPGDDMPELKIPTGKVFLLGDNRDNSADSRIPTEYGGLGGPVALSNIVGRPLYESWGSSRPIGTKLF